MRFLERIGIFLLLPVLAYSLQWTIETVDKGGPGRHSSMKVDQAGNAHVVYSVEDGDRFPLRYAFWDAKVRRWFTMTVADGAGACSLVLDSKERPHISWVDAGSNTGSKLHHASWTGDSWKKEAIPLPSENVAYYNSIAMAANDKPVISFYEYRGPRDSGLRIRLRAVMWNGEAWELRTVDAQEGSGKFNSIAADSAGRVHLAYANVSEGTSGLRYATWNGRAWQTEVIESGATGFSTFVAVDPTGTPHIAYADTELKVMKIASRQNGKWRIEAVEAVAGVGFPDRNSIAFDEQGRIYVTYYDAGQATLRLARRNGDRWQTETVDTGGAGFTSSAVVRNGVLWISYADESGGGLKVARATLAAQPVSSAVPAGSTPAKPDGSHARIDTHSDAAVKR